MEDDVNKLFQSEKRESAVDLVVNSIKQLLMDRKLKPGDKIPNELEISEGLGVSRGSVREAMKILSAYGLIDIRVGNGTYICEAPGNDLMDSLLFSFYLTNPDMDDLKEFREKIEEDTLELILDHYDQNQEIRNKLVKNFKELQNLINNKADLQQITNNDLGFHHLMGDATCNGLAARVYDFMITIMEPSIQASHIHQDGKYVFTIHRDIVDLIQKRDYSKIHGAVQASAEVWCKLQPNFDDIKIEK